MFFEKTECLANTYKSGSLKGKLPRTTISEGKERESSSTACISF